MKLTVVGTGYVGLTSGAMGAMKKIGFTYQGMGR